MHNSSKMASDIFSKILKKCAEMKITIKQLFERFDLDADKIITFEELKQVFNQMKLDYSEGDVLLIMKELDKNNNKKISQ